MNNKREVINKYNIIYFNIFVISLLMILYGCCFAFLEEKYWYELRENINILYIILLGVFVVIDCIIIKNIYNKLLINNRVKKINKVISFIIIIGFIGLCILAMRNTIMNGTKELVCLFRCSTIYGLKAIIKTIIELVIIAVLFILCFVIIFLVSWFLIFITKKLFGIKESVSLEDKSTFSQKKFKLPKKIKIILLIVISNLITLIISYIIITNVFKINIYKADFYTNEEISKYLLITINDKKVLIYDKSKFSFVINYKNFIRKINNIYAEDNTICNSKHIDLNTVKCNINDENIKIYLHSFMDDVEPAYLKMDSKGNLSGWLEEDKNINFKTFSFEYVEEEKQVIVLLENGMKLYITEFYNEEEDGFHFFDNDKLNFRFTINDEYLEPKFYFVNNNLIFMGNDSVDVYINNKFEYNIPFNNNEKIIDICKYLLVKKDNDLEVRDIHNKTLLVFKDSYNKYSRFIIKNDNIYVYGNKTYLLNESKESKTLSAKVIGDNKYVLDLIAQEKESVNFYINYLEKNKLQKIYSSLRTGDFKVKTTNVYNKGNLYTYEFNIQYKGNTYKRKITTESINKVLYDDDDIIVQVIDLDSDGVMLGTFYKVGRW